MVFENGVVLRGIGLFRRKREEVAGGLEKTA
jgi:hypothetical protein